MPVLRYIQISVYQGSLPSIFPPSQCECRTHEACEKEQSCSTEVILPFNFQDPECYRKFSGTHSATNLNYRYSVKPDDCRLLVHLFCLVPEGQFHLAFLRLETSKRFVSPSHLLTSPTCSNTFRLLFHLPKGSDAGKVENTPE